MSHLYFLAATFNTGLVVGLLMAVTTVLLGVFCAWQRKGSLCFLGPVIVVFTALLAYHGWDYLAYDEGALAIPNHPSKEQLFNVVRAVFVGGLAGIVAGLAGKFWVEKFQPY